MVAGCVRQMVILYSNYCMGLAWADSAWVILSKWLFEQV